EIDEADRAMRTVRVELGLAHVSVNGVGGPQVAFDFDEGADARSAVLLADARALADVNGFAADGPVADQFSAGVVPVGAGLRGRQSADLAEEPDEAGRGVDCGL